MPCRGGIAIVPIPGPEESGFVLIFLGACLETRFLGQSTGHQMDHRDLDHRFTAGRLLLVDLAEPPIPAQPTEGPLHHPATRQDHGPRRVVRPLDDLQGQAPGSECVADPLDQGPGIAAVGPDLLEAVEAAADRLQDQLGPVAILDGGRVDRDRQEQPQRIDQDAPLAAIDLLALVVTMAPPFSVVLTDWLSRTAAEGWR